MTAQIVHAQGEHTAQIVIQKPSIGRKLAWGTGIFFLALGILGYVIGILYPSPGFPPFMTNLTLILGIVIALIGFGMAGPGDLILDGRTRKYTLTVGVPLLAKTVHGEMDDINAIVFKEYRGHGTSGTLHQLCVEWKDPKRKLLPLIYIRYVDAYPMQDQIKASTGLPVRWEK